MMSTNHIIIIIMRSGCSVGAAVLFYLFHMIDALDFMHHSSQMYECLFLPAPVFCLIDKMKTYFFLKNVYKIYDIAKYLCAPDFFSSIFKI